MVGFQKFERQNTFFFLVLTLIFSTRRFWVLINFYVVQSV